MSMYNIALKMLFFDKVKYFDLIFDCNRYFSDVTSILSPFLAIYPLTLISLAMYLIRIKNDMTTYIFPGQGSQSVGMGSALFPAFPDLVALADQVLGYSITQLCLEGGDQLNNTAYTQPALYVVSALSYLKKVQETGEKPDYVAGHSLGEYNALFAAGVFDFATGLKLVQKRGELMNKASGGSMAAVVGLKSDNVNDVLDKNNLTNITIANYNSNTQLVLTGPKEEIIAAQPIFEKAGAMMFIPLKVSGAFHSQYMGEAQQQFADFLQKFTLSAPLIPVIANINAQPYQSDQLYTNLAEQITHSVQWVKTIEYLMAQGETIFEEVGPGAVLTGLVRRIQKGQ